MTMLAKVLPRASAQAKPFAAFVGDEESRAAIISAAAEIGIAEPTIVGGTVSDAMRRLSNVPTPKLLLIDLTGSADPLADVTALAEVCDEGSQVVTIGDVNDINLYRTLVGFGVHDYLVKPVAADVLAASLARAKDGPQAAETAQHKGGRLVAVVGVRGGVGATTVAVNTAWMLAHEYGQKVALVDLDLFFGSCGLTLDLESGRGFREALENPSRIDGLFIERAMVRGGANLFVLSAEEALDYAITFDPSAIDLLLEHLRRDFQAVVVDLPRFAARTQTPLLTPPCSIALVSDPSLAAMRDTMRLANLFKKGAPKAELQVVLNRVGLNKGSELSKKDFEQGAETRADHVVPYDAKAFAAAAGSGKPLAKAGAASKATAALRALTVTVAGSGVKSAKIPIWQQWLGLKAKG